MPDNEQQDKTLSEIVVKEAVGKGMDSPMRDSILEAVEEADGSTPGAARNLPLAGALFGAGAVLGFLAGRESPDLEGTSLEDVQEPDIIEDVIEETTKGGTETTEDEEVMTETESETADDGGSSNLSRILLAVGLIAGVAVLRRRLSSGEEEEWEPIEEFEPATDDELDEDEAEESEAEEAEISADESDDESDDTEEE